MKNKTYIIVNGNNDYGALNYEDKYEGLSLHELNKVYNEEEDDFVYKEVKDLIPSEDTEKILYLLKYDIIDEDSCKHRNIYLIDKI